METAPATSCHPIHSVASSTGLQYTRPLWARQLPVRSALASRRTWGRRHRLQHFGLLSCSRFSSQTWSGPTWLSAPPPRVRLQQQLSAALHQLTVRLLYCCQLQARGKCGTSCTDINRNCNHRIETNDPPVRESFLAAAKQRLKNTMKACRKSRPTIELAMCTCILRVRRTCKRLLSHDYAGELINNTEMRCAIRYQPTHCTQPFERWHMVVYPALFTSLRTLLTEGDSWRLRW